MTANNIHPDELQSFKLEWDALQPLSTKNDRRFWQKLRLEWNYHSNHIEGNTLTYGETELLLIHGQTHGNHSIREYEEMQAHDVGIAHLRDLAADHLRFISESDIRNLNKIILKEPFWKPAQTVDGKPSRKQIIPGEYKTSPNNVVTATGELFAFVDPAEVPTKMQELVQAMRVSLDAGDRPILTQLAKLHHDFVLIHPFDDGNGRVARMLVNYVLMRQGYPPIIVPTERKKDYLTALRLADAGDLAEFEKFIESCVLRSLELGIKAAKGESLDEPGDLEKEIKLFTQKQIQNKDRVIAKSNKAIKDIFENGLKMLFGKIVEKYGVFRPLFVETKCVADPPSPNGNSDVIECFEYQLSQNLKSFTHFSILFVMRGYQGEAKNPFNIQQQLTISFEEFVYAIIVDNKIVIRKLYTESLLHEDIEEVVEKQLRSIFKVIKSESSQS